MGTGVPGFRTANRKLLFNSTTEKDHIANVIQVLGCSWQPRSDADFLEDYLKLHEHHGQSDVKIVTIDSHENSICDWKDSGEFIRGCLAWTDTDRLTPEQGLLHSWMQ